MMLLHFRVGLNLHVIPERTLRELKSLQRLVPPFKGKHLEQV